MRLASDLGARKTHTHRIRNHPQLWFAPKSRCDEPRHCGDLGLDGFQAGAIRGLWFPWQQPEGRITLLPILEPIESLNSLDQ
jgi:hypothetical protein